MLNLRPKKAVNLVAFAVCLCCLSAAGSAAAPRIALEREEWNFGHKWVGEKAETTVVLRNDGDAPLNLLQVRTSCGCTVARSTKRVLPPGDTDTLHLTFDTTKPNPKANQKITIESNDPRRPTVEIAVFGQVEFVYRTAPEDKLYFGLISEQARLTRSLELTNNMDQPVVLTLPALDDQNYDIKFEEVERGRKYRLTAATRTPLEPGYHPLEIKLATGLADHPVMPVLVAATVLEPVAVLPAKIGVPFGDGLPSTRRISLRYLASMKLNITDITTSNPHIKVRRLPAPASRPPDTEFETIPLAVDLPAFNNITPGMEIVIKTDATDERFRSLTVPIAQAQSPKVTMVPKVATDSAPSNPTGEPPEEP